MREPLAWLKWQLCQRPPCPSRAHLTRTEPQGRAEDCQRKTWNCKIFPDLPFSRTQGWRDEFSFPEEQCWGEGLSNILVTPPPEGSKRPALATGLPCLDREGCCRLSALPQCENTNRGYSRNRWQLAKRTRMRRGNEGRGWEQQWRTRFTSTPGRSIGRTSSGLLERAEGSGIRPFPRAQASFRKEVVCQGWKGFLEYLKFLNSLSCCTGALLAGSEKNAISDAKGMTILHMRKSCN